MSKTVEELQMEELENLAESEEIAGLESLIVDGTETRIPIIIEIPQYDKKTGKVEIIERAARIRPLTSIEINNASRLSTGRGSANTTFDIEILKAGLYGLDGEKVPLKIIKALPGGVTSQVANQIREISGIKLNSKENIELTKELMGFSD